MSLRDETSEREEMARALDRWRVLTARRQGRWTRVLWLLAGPGILVMLGENDGPSMLSYAATGSQFGIGFFLPFVVLTFAMAFVAQEITVRLGAATQSGHAELIYRRYGRFWGNFAMVDLMVTNFMTLVTEFVAIVAGASYFGIPKVVAVSGGVAVVASGLALHRYWAWERLTMALALFNLVFIPVAVLTHPDWGAVGRAMVTFSPLPGGFNANTVTLLLADIGATITPWMLFFQQGAVSDKGLTGQDIREGRWDTAIGALVAALAALGCIVATAPLHTHHMNAASYNAAQFAQALVPFAGRWGSALFALGVLEAGLVASATISVSSAYAWGEVLGKAHSLNRPPKEAPGFYAVLVGVAALAAGVVLIPHFPLEMVVILVNVIAVLTMPPAIGFLLLLANDPEVIGRYRSSRLLNVLGIGVGCFVALAGIVYALTVILPALFGSHF